MAASPPTDRSFTTPDADAVQASGPLPNLAGLDQTPGFLLSLAQRYAFQVFDDFLGDSGLSPRLYSTLALIEMNPGCRQVDIGETLGVLQTNLVKRIDALVDRGLVVRGRDPNDRRSKTLRLTPEGLAFARAARDRHADMLKGMRTRMGEDEMAQMLALLARFIAIEAERGGRPRTLDDDA